MIIILLLGVLITACGVWLMKMVIDAKRSKSYSSDNKMEFTEEMGYTLVSMGIVMIISSIVKLFGGIATGAFVFVFILNIIVLAALLYLIYQKHYSHK